VHPVRKYLAGWAEPEASIARGVEQHYERALVVPACRECPALLEGYVRAADTSRGRTLCILVVNGPDDATEGECAENTAFLESTRGVLERVREVDGPHRAWLGAVPRASLDVLLVDRASEGVRLPRKEGVGLARKIGMDIALALHHGGRVASRLLFGTDADTSLPEGFFERPPAAEWPGVVAVLSPFWHEASPDSAVTRATAFHELSLRYYVEGLAWAGSPYAFHTLGSATAVEATAYAAVRGVPRREAAEDFYLLNKLAKVGGVVRASGAPVRIRSRTSDRTPFGTGASVAGVLAGAERVLYAPGCFAGLGAFLRCLDALSEHASLAQFHTAVAAIDEGPRDAIRALLSAPGAEAALDAATREAKTTEARLCRLHSWFDAFRTLKLVHAIRERSSPSLPWREALRHAPFHATAARDETSGGGSDEALAAPRAAYARREAERPTVMGAWARRMPPDRAQQLRGG
jgi:hypothetical protein